MTHVAGPAPRRDVIAGLTVGAVLVPQGLAYGELAGLTPIAGLYAALAGIIVYAAVGSSSLISLGPTATSAILAAAAGQEFASDERAAPIVTAALMAGGLALAAGIVRLGFVANLLSRPVLVGYTAGAAVTIAASQLGNLLGIDVDGRLVTAMLADVFGGLSATSLVTLALSAASLVGLVLLQQLRPRLPAALLVVVAATAVTRIFDLADHGVAVVGALPRGLPEIGLPDLAAGDLDRLVLPAAAIALVGFAETVAQGQALGETERAPDPNRELMALGGANIASGLCAGFSVSSSFSRNALNVGAGGRSQRAFLVAAGAVVVSLVALTNALGHVPLASLAAVVVVSVVALIPVRTFRRLAHLQRDDFVFALVAFAGVILIGILPGLAVAVALSLGGLLYRVTTADTTVLGYVPDEDTWRRLDRYDTAQARPGVLVVRFSGPLYFANASRLRRQVSQLVAESSPGLRRVVIDGRAMGHLDATAIEVLTELHARLGQNGIELVMAGLRRPALDTFLRSDLVRTVGEEELVYATVRAATDV